MKVILWAVLALAGMMGTVSASMPDCLSGICLRQAYSPEFFKKEGFTAKPNACEETTEYVKHDRNIHIRVLVFNYAIGGNETNTPHNIKREMEFGRERELLEKLNNAFLEKYGEPSRKTFITEEPYANAKLLYFDEQGPDGKTKTVSVFRVYPSGIWATVEEIEDFRGFNDHLERFSRCEKSEKANKAKSIIPD